MNGRSILVPAVIVAFLGGAALLINRPQSAVRAAAADPPASADLQRQVEQLQQQVKQLEGLVPDQAAIMTHVAYHFTNLHSAVEKGNWPLAEFYLGETLNNIKWAVRSKPFRKDPAGNTVDLNAIAQSIENTQFKELREAIAAKDKSRCDTAYEQTLAGCYACHTASGKPYLKPYVPADAEVRIINFDPAAVVPH